MTPLYIACYKDHVKVVQLLLDHNVQMDVSDKVSKISCVRFITTENNNDTLAKKIKMIMIMCL